MHPLLFQMGVPWNSIISIAACESLKGDLKVTLILFSHLFQDDKRMKFWQGHPDKTTLWPPSNSGTLFFLRRAWSVIIYTVHVIPPVSCGDHRLVTLYTGFLVLLSIILIHCVWLQREWFFSTFGDWKRVYR